MKSFMRLIQSYGRLTGIPPTKATQLQGHTPVLNKLSGAELASMSESAKTGLAGGSQLDSRSESAKRLKGLLTSMNTSYNAAAVVVRSLIRESRRNGEMSIELLSVLYDLAAIESFVHAFPVDPEGKIPSRHVFEFIQPEQWERILRYEYETLGYEQLTILNKTDRAWLKAVWGEPNVHTTLRALKETEWSEALQRTLRSNWQHEIEIPTDLAPGEFELHYSKFQPMTFEEYLEMGRKNWEFLVDKNNRELGCLDINNTNRKNWERFKARMGGVSGSGLEKEE